MRRYKAFFSATLLSMVCAAKAAAYDMRDCPLDALTFVDPWSHSYFRPELVGVNLYFFCDGDRRIVRSQTNPGGCSGPYGDVMPKGFFVDAGNTSSLLAVYSYYRGASPCCGWSVFSAGEKPDIEGMTDWLPSGAAPRLSEWPFASIVNTWGTRNDMDGVVALICEMPSG